MNDNEYFGLTCEALCEGLATLIHRYEESGIDFYISWSYGEWGKGQYTIKKHINVILSDAIAMLKNQHEEIGRLKKQEAVEPEVDVLNEIDRLYRCPKCHKHFFYRKQKYCDQCGQEIEWND